MIWHSQRILSGKGTRIFRFDLPVREMENISQEIFSRNVSRRNAKRFLRDTYAGESEIKIERLNGEKVNVEVYGNNRSHEVKSV